MPYAEEAQRARATSADAPTRRFIPAAEVLRERQSSLNPPAGQSGMPAAPSFLSQLMPSRAAWQAALDTAPFPGAARKYGKLAHSLPSQKGRLNLKQAIEALGGRVMSVSEYFGARQGSRAAQPIGLERQQYIPVTQRIVGPGGQRLEDPAYLYEYAKEWYRQAAMRAHPDKGGTEDAMKAVNAAWAFIEKHHGSEAVRAALNPQFFAR